MRLYSPTVLVIVGGFIAAHGLGLLDVTAKVISAVDETANKVIDLRKVVPQIKLPPPPEKKVHK